MKVEGRTNLIFKLRYLHDKSEILILRQRNKQMDKIENK